jgi:hypothetical protein
MTQDWSEATFRLFLSTQISADPDWFFFPPPPQPVRVAASAMVIDAATAVDRMGPLLFRTVLT